MVERCIGWLKHARRIATRFEKTAVNFLAMLKLAMISVHRALREGGFRTRMLLTVHDELVFDMHREEAEQVMPLIEECMKTALPLQCPIEIEMGTGQNWLEAH